MGLMNEIGRSAGPVSYTHLTDEFIRIRIGIGPKEKETDIIKFVLGNFPRDQKEQMDNAFDRAADAALVIIKSGVNAAMNQFNQASISQDSV